VTGTGPPSPREWLEGWPFPWPALHSLPEGETVRACFCVVSAQLARTRSEQPYFRLTLSDRNGALEARLWDEAEQLAERLAPGAYVGVQGRVEYYHGQLQLCLEAVSALRVGLEDLELFLPRSARSAEAMDAELETLTWSIREAGLRRLVQRLLGPESDVGPGFRLAPAAKFNHHAYLGGLLEHTVSVTSVCARLAQHYGGSIDRDLLVTAALLHDVGKVREIGARAGFPYTDEGKLLGHILLGLQMVTEAAAAVTELSPASLLLLQHLIASHQGRYEWQSPREPAMLEGLILHYADDLDAKLQQVAQLLAQGEGSWTAYDRGFRREFLRHRPPTPDQVTTAPAAVEFVPDDDPEGRETTAPPDPLQPVTLAPEPPADHPAEPPPNGGAGVCTETLDLFGSPDVD